MFKHVTILIALFSTITGQSQEPTQAKDFYHRGAVKRNGDTVHTHGEDARPLWVAADALAREYGWLISYEEPMFDRSTETVRANNQVWDSLHPERPSRIPAGTSIDSDFSEPLQAAKTAGRESRLLSKLVQDYNHSANSGRFVLSQQSTQRFTLLGESRRGGTERST